MLAPNTEDIASADDSLSSLFWFQLLLLARACCLNLGSGHRIGHLPLRPSTAFETFSFPSAYNPPATTLTPYQGFPISPLRVHFLHGVVCARAILPR